MTGHTGDIMLHTQIIIVNRKGGMTTNPFDPTQRHHHLPIAMKIKSVHLGHKLRKLKEEIGRGSLMPDTDGLLSARTFTTDPSSQL